MKNQLLTLSAKVDEQQTILDQIEKDKVDEGEYYLQQMSSWQSIVEDNKFLNRIVKLSDFITKKEEYKALEAVLFEGCEAVHISTTVIKVEVGIYTVTYIPKLKNFFIKTKAKALGQFSTFAQLAELTKESPLSIKKNR